MPAYDPSLYDLFHDPDAADVRFYVEQARESGGRVLELGAGTGRTLLPVARAGIEVDGLELEENMLAGLRSKLASEPEPVRGRVELFRGDMRRFSLSERYASIHIPFRAFLHNVDAASQLECLRCCFEHLRPNGRVVFNVFHPSLSFMARNHNDLAGVWRWRDERIAAGGERVLLSEATKYDTIRQRVSSRLRYDVYSSANVLERTELLALDLAYLYPSDVRERLTAAGFVDVHIMGGFDGRPLEKDTDEMVISAARP